SLGGEDGFALGVAWAHSEFQFKIAQAIVAQQDAENLDTLDAFLPPGDAKGHTFLQAMREKKKAQVEHLLDEAAALRARLTNIVTALCAHANDDPNGEQMLRTALDPDSPNNGAPVTPPADTDRADNNEAPPGGWPDPSMPPPPDDS